MTGNLSANQASGLHFLSYSRIDAAEFALRLYDELCSGPEPADVWLDRRDIRPGQDWDREIESAIRRCGCLLFVMTRDSVHPDSICTDEWHLARSCKKPIIPLAVHDDAVPPMLLSRRQRIDFTGDFRTGLAELRAHLRFMASPEGELLATEDRLRDAERTRDRARTDKERARVQPHIDELRRQIEEQRMVLQNPQRSIRRVTERVAQEHLLIPPAPAVEEGGVNVVNAPPLPPELLSYFVDRYDETSRLLECLRNDAFRLVLIAGPGGMGKTAMVCRLLTDIERRQLPEEAGRFEVDSIVYLDAGGAPALSLPTVLDDLGQALPDADRGFVRSTVLNTDLSPARKMQDLLTVIGRRRVLVLLDGLERMLDSNTQELRDPDLGEALEALLAVPGHNVKVICTTRTLPRPLMRVQPERQTLIDLVEGLQTADAAELLARLDPGGALGLRDASRDLLEEARRRTGGQPRALVALRRVLYVDVEKTLPEVLDRTSDLLPDEVVEALIGEAFDRLDRPAQLVMQALAVYGQAVSSAAVDYLLLPFLSGRLSEPVLHRLVDMYLIGHRTGRSGTTYVLGPTEQAFAYRLIPVGQPEDRLADPVPFTRFALSHWGAEFCRQARENAGEPNGMDDLQLHLMEIDLRCSAEEYEAAADLLVKASSSYLLPWGQTRLVAALCERLDGKLTDQFLAYQMILLLATSRTWLGEEELAVPQFERAREVAHGLEDRASESMALILLASCLFELGQVSAAGERYEEALGIAHSVGDRRLEANALTGLALCKAQEGSIQQALERYETALAITVEVGDRRLEATVRANIGSVLGEMGRTAEAHDLLEHGLDVARAVGDHQIEGNCLAQSAVVLIDLDDPDTAINYARRAARIGDRIHNPRLAQDGYEALALAQFLAGELDAARAAIETACQRGADSRTRGHDTLALFGMIALRQGDRSSARKAFSRARGRAENLLRAEGGRLPRVLDTKGLILTGLGLCGPEGSDRYLEDAIVAFSAARDLCLETGLVGRVLRLFDTVSPGGEDDPRLAAVRAAASRAPARRPK